MIADWLLVGAVFAVLWLFWLWLGVLFDAISDYHHHFKQAAPKQDGEASEAAKGTGS